MAIFKCKHCGYDMNLSSGFDILECPNCNAVQIVPEPDVEKKISLYNVANRLRMLKEFSKASSIYEAIAAKFDEVEAYYGILLCKYGVIYDGDDLKCSIIRPNSIYFDPDYLTACDISTDSQLDIMTIEADLIENSQKELKKLAEQYKNSDITILVNDSNKKNDSYIVAKEIYEVLKAEGKKVFFPSIHLASLEGDLKEACLYKALSTSKLLVLFATNPTRLNEKCVIDVLNKYYDFYELDNKKYKIVPCLKDIDESDIPYAIKGLDIIDLGKDTFIDKILDVVDSTFKVEISQLDKYLKILEDAIKDSNYDTIIKSALQVIKLDKKNELAYMHGLMATFEVDTLDEVVSNAYDPLFNNDFYLLSLENGVDVLTSVNDKICENIYSSILNMRKSSKEEIDIYVSELSRIRGYKDVNSLIDNAYDTLYKDKYDEAYSLYQKGLDTKFERTLLEASRLFKEIIDYKDSRNIVDKIDNYIEKLNAELCDGSYQNGISLFKNAKTMADYKEAQTSFMKVMSYKDSKLWILQCKDRMYMLACEATMNSMESSVVEEAISIFKFLHPYKETAYFYEKAQARVASNDFNPNKRKIRV